MGSGWSLLQRSWLAAQQLLRRVWKGILRRISGTCELQRLTSSHCHSPLMTEQVVKCIGSSRELISIRNKILFSHDFFEIDKTIDDIQSIKRIRFSNTERVNSELCLQVVLNIHAIMTVMQNTKRRSFNWESVSDFKLIDNYWSEMFPNVRRKSRTVSQEWGELGFQGSDPSTDFRGMGMLGLIQLHYFASMRHSEAKKVLGDAMHPRRYYPFSATGINITSFVMELLLENRLHRRLIQRLEEERIHYPSPDWQGGRDDSLCGEEANNLLVRACDTLHEVYCDVFVEFNELWVETDPPNIMHFASIFDQIKAVFRLRYPVMI